MKIRNLMIGHTSENRWIDPAGSPLFSFCADADTAYQASVLTHDGTVIARRAVTLSEALGFHMDGLSLIPDTRYRLCVSCGEVSAGIDFETAVTFTAPFITPVETIASPALSRSFLLPGDVHDVRLAVTGLGLYRAFLNESRVGDRYLTPGCNDYDAYVRFDTYDVTALCRPGAENRLTVELGDGWYSGRYGIDKPPEYGGRVWGELPLAALMLYEADGGRVLLQSDEAFTAAACACVESSIYDGEIRDYTRPLGKPVACRVAERSLHAVPFFGSPIRAREILKPGLISSPKGEQILDFGENVAGFVRFRAHLPRGTRIRILHGEVLQNGCFYRDNLRTARAEAVYVSDGHARVYEPYFTYFGFRYALVEGMETVDPADFEGVVLSSDTAPVSVFHASDKRLECLTENARRSQRGNFFDIPTDCPQRDERLGWTADTQVFSPTACYHGDCFAFYEKYLYDLRYEQTAYYGGDIPMYAPSLCGEAGRGGAVWADCATILPTVLYRFYGDRSQLMRDYPLMRDYCDLLLARDLAEGDRGLITKAFTFGDWLAQDGVCEQALSGGTDNGYISSLYYVHSLRLTADAAEILGLLRDRDRFRKAAVRARLAVLDEYFAPSGRLTVDTQTAYLLALRFGIYRDRQVLLHGLRERLRKDFYQLRTGFCGTPLLLPTLFECGMDDDAYRILFDPEVPGWMYALGLGATTIWERWNTLLPDGRISGVNMNSLNHYAYGSVCEAIYGDIVGLRPCAPGWREAAVKPHPNYRLRSVSFRFDSPCGRYALSWRMTEDDRFLVDLTVPVGCRALLTMPDGGTEVLGGGEWQRSIAAPRHLLYPFSLDTPNLDIVRHPAAAECLRTHLPHAWEMVTGENREFLVQNGHFLTSLPMFGAAPEEAERYRMALEKIRA